MKTTNKLLIAGIVLTGLGVVTKYLLDKFLLDDTEMNFDDELELMDVEEPVKKEKSA